MVIMNKNIELLDRSYFIENEVYHFINCVVDNFDLLGSFEFNTNLIFEKCIINSMRIHSCWFVEGFTIKNCVVNNDIDYQMGGHNKRPILIEACIFNGFFNFFDCQFESTFTMVDNVFKRGTNILGNEGTEYENTFANGCIVRNNLGEVDLDMMK